MKKTILLITMVILLTISCKNDKKGGETKESETPTEVVSEKDGKIVEEAKEAVHKFNKETFNFSITGYGAKDKSYVVTDIVFKKFEVNSSNNQLLGTKLSLTPDSIDTSKNLNNGQGGEWPAEFAAIRNGNIINSFFNNLTVKEDVKAEITRVNEANVDLKITLNGISKIVKMDYTVDESGVLLAIGKMDILDFNANEAFKSFSSVCNVAFHQGKTWSEIGLKFTVNVK